MPKGWQKGWREVYKRFLNKFYRDKVCSICGNSKPPYHYHHRDPSTKEHEIIHMWSYSDEKVQKEVDKCDILCENCHKQTDTWGKRNGV